MASAAWMLKNKKTVAACAPVMETAAVTAAHVHRVPIMCSTGCSFPASRYPRVGKCCL